MQIRDKINLDKIHDSGQVFRWHKLDQGRYLVPHQNSLCLAEQVTIDAVKVSSLEGPAHVWPDYFDLGHNYQDLEKELVARHPELKEALEVGSGIRLLRQAPHEMIVTFIVSANNNIPRIRKFIDGLCTGYGKQFARVHGQEVFAFPSLEVLATLTDQDFRVLGAGYRSAYLVETCRRLLEDQDFKSLDKVDDANLVRQLLSLKGVGIKVAECIALFGFGRWHVFPVDTWIKKSASHYLQGDLSSDLKIRQAFEAQYPLWRGLVQQHIFYYMRTHTISED